MNFIDTNDPTSIGAMIIIVLVIIGALAASRLLRPLERMLADKALARSKSKKTVSSVVRNPAPYHTSPLLSRSEPPAPARTISTGTATPIAQRASQALDIQHQWDRIAERLGGDIERVKEASQSHNQAETQLHAAEFSLSELFREFPGARDTLNPVTYIEFPDIKARPADEHPDDQADEVNQAATA